jgi:hypothetical protein
MRFFSLFLQTAVLVLVTTGAPVPRNAAISGTRATAATSFRDVDNTRLDTALLDSITHELESRDPQNRNDRKGKPGRPGGGTKPLAVGNRALSPKPNRKGKDASTTTDRKGKGSSASTDTTATTADTAANTLTLLDAVNNFDMAVEVLMVKPKASGTNTVPATAMVDVLTKAGASANIPPQLFLTQGNFQASVEKSWLQVKDTTRLPSAIALLRSASEAKTQYESRPISGELDLTQVRLNARNGENAKRRTGRGRRLEQNTQKLTVQVITQGLAAPATEVLAAIGHSNAYWFGVGRGGAPVPDLQLNVSSEVRAVVEIKTTDSLSNLDANKIFNDFDKFTMTMLTSRKGDSDDSGDNGDDDDSGDASKAAVMEERGRGSKKGPTGTTTTTKAKGEGKKGPLVIPSITHSKDISEGTTERHKRLKVSRVLEQVGVHVSLEVLLANYLQLLSQMWATGAMLGAITNLETWLIVEQIGAFEFKITKVSGMKADGTSNGLNVMLAMSSQALAI